MADPTKIPIEYNPQRKRMVGQTLHGGIKFDVPFITQVAYNLWQGGCTDGLILPTHINFLVSLYPWERYTINHKMDGELYVRMYDDPTQDVLEIDELARLINVWRGRGTVLVHCQAGLNRSSLVVARTLMHSGLPAGKAIDLLRTKRSAACLCNPAFEAWLRNTVLP